MFGQRGQEEYQQTYKWSCRLNPLLQMEHTYLLSSLCVSLCLANALDDPKILPHCSHLISGLPPESGLGLPLDLAAWDFLSASSMDWSAGLSLSLLIDTDGDSDLLDSSMAVDGDAGLTWWGLTKDFELSARYNENSWLRD